MLLVLGADLPVAQLQLTDLGDSQNIVEAGLRKVSGTVKDKVMPLGCT